MSRKDKRLKKLSKQRKYNLAENDEKVIFNCKIHKKLEYKRIENGNDKILEFNELQKRHRKVSLL